MVTILKLILNWIKLNKIELNYWFLSVDSENSQTIDVFSRNPVRFYSQFSIDWMQAKKRRFSKKITWIKNVMLSIDCNKYWILDRFVSFDKEFLRIEFIQIVIKLLIFYENTVFMHSNSNSHSRWRDSQWWTSVFHFFLQSNETELKSSQTLETFSCYLWFQLQYQTARCKCNWIPT